MTTKSIAEKLLFVLLICIIYSCDKDVSISKPESWPTEKASIYISSKPSNAEIFVDGKSTGLKTPDTIKWLSNGEHEITLKMYLFMDYSFPMIAHDEHFNTYFHDYYKYPYNFAKITINSSPESANIYFDDSLLSQKTPTTLKNIFPGNHKIKLTYPNHRADSLQMFYQGGTDKNLNFALEDTSIWVNYNQFNSIVTSYTINDVKAINDQEVWIATMDKGIFSYKGNKWRNINSENSMLPTNGINKIVLAPNNDVWLCTFKGVTIYNGTEWKSITTYNSKLPSNYVTDVFFHNDTVLIGTQNGLAKLYNNEIEVIHMNNSGIPANFITAIEVDKYNSLWLGTAGMGILNYRNGSWTQFTAEVNFLPGNGISDIILDDNGTIIVSIYERENKGERGGIVYWEGGIWNEFNFEVVFPSTKYIFKKEDGSLLLATRSGVIWYRTIHDYDIFNAGNSGLIRNDITSTGIDSKGSIWISSKGGGITKYKIWNE